MRQTFGMKSNYSLIKIDCKKWFPSMLQWTCQTNMFTTTSGKRTSMQCSLIFFSTYSSNHRNNIKILQIMNKRFKTVQVTEGLVMFSVQTHFVLKTTHSKSPFWVYERNDGLPKESTLDNIQSHETDLIKSPLHNERTDSFKTSPQPLRKHPKVYQI